MRAKRREPPSTFDPRWLDNVLADDEPSGTPWTPRARVRELVWRAFVHRSPQRGEALRLGPAIQRHRDDDPPRLPPEERRTLDAQGQP